MMTRVALPIFALAVAAAFPATSGATDLTIENYTNGRLLVALAYKKWDGDVAARGWYAIASGDQKKFSTDDAHDLYVRVQDDSSNEITWPGYNTFTNWQVSGDAFTVSKEPDDNTVRILKSGSNITRIRNGDALPDGWVNLRFFRVGSGAKKLRLDPN